MIELIMWTLGAMTLFTIVYHSVAYHNQKKRWVEYDIRRAAQKRKLEEATK